jgi:hypothetical protein
MMAGQTVPTSLDAAPNPPTFTQWKMAVAQVPAGGLPFSGGQGRHKESAVKANGLMDAAGDSLAARRYRQLCESNIPSAFAERLVRRTKEPAVPEADMLVGPPDFIGIGSMKSGTTWWYSLMIRHPQIYSPSWRKELHFFDLLIGSPYGPTQVEEYHRLFCRPHGMICGEWTPRYVSDFWVPRAIHLAAPDAKLLLLLRDPVNRFISGVTHQITRNVLPKISIVDLWPSHFARGLYYQQISRYLRFFPRNQLLVLQFERCIESPLAELERTFRFLGLDMPESITAEVLRRRRNRTKPEAKVKLPPHVLSPLIDDYQEDVEKLVREFPEISLELWPHFRNAR